MDPRKLLRIGVTLAITLVAVVIGVALWHHYMDAPWTRDGRIAANVVAVAPDVSGLVTRVAVHDNQLVKKGDLLFSIDPARYRDAIATDKAAVALARVTAKQRQRELARRQPLSGVVVSSEDLEIARAKAQGAKAKLVQAQSRLSLAQLNLARTDVHAPADGYITHLNVFTGDYAVTGKPLLALVESGSFRVDGYFEETKLRHIHIGDPVTIDLIGGGPRLHGHVQSIARGIANRNESNGGDLLAKVSPTFSWVRLAQRVPVRISIDSIPDDLTLAAGMTATVVVHARRKSKTENGSR